MKIFYLLFLITMMFLFTGAVYNNFPDATFENQNIISNINSDSKDNLHKEFKTEEGKTLDINLESGGSIDISGWDKNYISVDVDSKRDNLTKYDFKFEPSSSGLQVTSEFKENVSRRNNSLKFTFMIPNKFNVSLETKGGPVSIKNVNGEISGQTMGGGLDLSNLKGNLNLKTMGGPINLYDSEVDGSVHTMGGPVSIKNVKGDVKGTTNGGPVTLKNVTSKSGKSTGDEVNISSMGGEINVDEAPNGADVKTLGGDITIKSAGKFVKAKTNGGSINIENADASIEAKTNGGDINAEMIGDASKGNRDVNLKSNSGDITLTVPENLSMDIDIRIGGVDKDGSQNQIYSDFPLKKEIINNDEYSSYTLHGSGTVNGGKNKVTIKTINGDVYLKKEK